MSPQDLTNAIISGINAGGEQFLEGTLAAVLPVVWLALLGLHLGRPYILDMIDRFTLRLGADCGALLSNLLRNLIVSICLRNHKRRSVFRIIRTNQTFVVIINRLLILHRLLTQWSSWVNGVELSRNLSVWVSYGVGIGDSSQRRRSRGSRQCFGRNGG